MANQSMCSPLRFPAAVGDAGAAGASVQIVAYNPVGSTKKVVLRLPWYVDTTLVPEVVDVSSGQLVPTAVVPSTATTAQQADALLPAHTKGATHTVLLYVTLPPLTTKVFVVRAKPKATVRANQPPARTPTPLPTQTQTQALLPDQFAPPLAPPPAPPPSIENENLKVEFNPSSGLVAAITDKISGRRINITQQLMYYDAAIRGDGPWMFSQNHTKPDGSGALCIGNRTGFGATPLESPHCSTTLLLFKTALAEEAHQVFSPWATQVVRLEKGAVALEFEWTVGPVPISDGVGKEVISRYTTSIDSGDQYFTDSNGLELVPRIRNFRPSYSMNVTTEPITVNYFPFGTQLQIRDTVLCSVCGRMFAARGYYWIHKPVGRV
jgi:lysosomal alpha-mannosidase